MKKNSLASKWSLKIRLTFLFGLFSIIACGVVALALAYTAREAILTDQSESLTAIRDSKVEALQILFDQFKQDANSLSVTKYFQDALVSMESLAYGTGVELSQDSDFGASTYYKNLIEKYSDSLKEYIDQYKIRNFYAVLNTGAVVVQGQGSGLVGMNLLNGKLKDSAYSKCYQAAKADSNKIYFHDLSVIGDSPTVLICKVIASKYSRDVYAKDAVMGVLMVELDWNRVLALIKSVHGLGDNGEMYVLAEDNTSRIAKDLLKPHDSDLIKGASSDQGGILIANNEAGESVMSGYQKIDLQGLHWKVFTDIPMSEVLAPVGSMYKLTFLIGLAISLGLAFIGYLVSNAISIRISRDAMELDKKAQDLLKMSESLSEASKDLAASSTQQAASLEETVATLEEISSIVKRNTSSTNSAAEESTRSRQGIESGKNEIGMLVSTMREMEASSKKIEEIITVIDDISFQTNLLALNAAVEAARAGEQGKGFAVVAEAVQSLAQRSAEAAKDIAVLINDSVSNIQKGVKTVENNNEILSKVFGSVTSVADLNHEIAQSIMEQSSGIDQISNGINQLDSSAQSNATTSEQISSSARSLESAAQDLRDLVGNLKGTVMGDVA